MRLADDTRQVAVQSLQLALTDERRDPQQDQAIQTKIERLKAAEWSELPPGIAEPLTEQYRLYTAGRAT